jgi:hypothetical protein
MIAVHGGHGYPVQHGYYGHGRKFKGRKFKIKFKRGFGYGHGGYYGKRKKW